MLYPCVSNVALAGLHKSEAARLVQERRRRARIARRSAIRACSIPAQQRGSHFFAERRSRDRERPGPQTTSRRIEAPILDRLGQVRRIDVLASGNIRDRARNAQDAVIRARGKTQTLDCAVE